MIALLTNFTATQAVAGVTVKAYATCAAWAKDRRSNIIYSEFALIGMLNGLAFTSGRNFWANLEPDQVFFWMDRYCDNNPLSNTTDGAIKLMNETTGTTYSKFIR
ncbi:hypothetical protein N9828_01320 [bacterium]|nr:hypothetical protein [bacterium]